MSPPYLAKAGDMSGCRHILGRRGCGCDDPEAAGEGQSGEQGYWRSSGYRVRWAFTRGLV